MESSSEGSSAAPAETGASADAGAQTDAVRPRPSGPGGIKEWVRRGAALAEAEAKLASLPHAHRSAHRRARIALELADRALDPVDPLRSGPGAGLSIELYRQAVCWTLIAAKEHPDQSDAGELLREVPRDKLLAAAGGPEELETVERFVGALSFLEVGQLHEVEQEAAARTTKRFAHALVSEIEGPQREIALLRTQRLVRTVLAVSLVGILLGLGGWGVKAATQPRDLAKGKPWKTSSSYAVCHPERSECGGSFTNILFHTQEEQSPWFEIDLGAPTSFSSVRIENRIDFGPDRAVPLVVEVSDDGRTYRQVATRNEAFETWAAKFPTQTARYVRVRALRRTILHLVSVRVSALGDARPRAACPHTSRPRPGRAPTSSRPGPRRDVDPTPPRRRYVVGARRRRGGRTVRRADGPCQPHFNPRPASAASVSAETCPRWNR